MIKFLQKLDFQLKDSSYLKFIIISYLIVLFCYLLPSLLMEHLFSLHPIDPLSKITNQFDVFVSSVIIGPIIETLIFQILLIKGFYIFLYIFLVDKITENKIMIYAIILSSLVFGGMHYYSNMYILMMFILGLFFGMIYYYSKRKKIYPFLPIAIIHSLYNLTVILFDKFT